MEKREVRGWEGEGVDLLQKKKANRRAEEVTFSSKTK